MSLRIGRAAAAAVVVALSMLAVPASPAGATTYYEYWSYWHKQPGSSSWQYSSVGPSGYYLKQGKQVEGWRFAVGTASPSDPKPRPTSATYDQYCSGKNTDKTYRVLLVVDYGTQSSAPSGPVYSCYGFDDSVTGFRVLTQQHSERDNGGLICAIDAYPRTGCGDTVSSPAPKHSTKPAAATPTATPHQSRPATPAPVASVQATHARASASPTSRQSTEAVLSTGSPSAQPTSTTPTLRPFTGAATAASSSFPWGLVLGLVGLVALGGGAVWLRRRSP